VKDAQDDSLRSNHADEHDVATYRDRSDIRAEFWTRLGAFRKIAQHIDTVEDPVAPT
jgi:hypothetical protein